MKRFASTLLISLMAAAGAAAAPPASLLRVTAAAEPASASAGGSFTLRIRAILEAGWHVNAHVPSEDYLIPTEARPDPVPGVTLSAFVYPPGKSVKFAFSDKPLSVYETSFEITAAGKLAPGAAPGARQITGVVSFQPCNDHQCLAPATVPFSAALAVTGASAAGSTSPPVPASGNPFSGRGLIPTLALLFVGGLALNLTPCVYPIIPITVGFFGGQAQKQGGRPIGLAAFYVLGMALTYSTLGLFAALSGRLFGAALQSPWVLGGIAFVLAALSLSMFGLYDINPPRFVMERAGARTGAGGALAMGLLVGIVAAPCLGPFVLGLLTFVASRRDPLLGFGMFFVLSLGLGLPYLFLAAFSGTIKSLPRAGEWMVEVKKIFGFVLLAMAAYFGKFLTPEPARSWLLPGVLAVGAVFLSTRLFRTGIPRPARAVLALSALLMLGAAAFFSPRGKADGSGTPFAAYSAPAVSAAARPAMIDFSADWCAPCHELEDITFADPRVRKKLASLALFKADMTRQDSPESIALSERFAIQGMPTIVFLDGAGHEIANSRLVGFEGPEQFLRRLERIGLTPDPSP